MADSKKSSDAQTHEGIVKPASTQCVLKALDDAKEGHRVGKELAPGPEVGWAEFAAR
jgi:hypothetical protein